MVTIVANDGLKKNLMFYILKSLSLSHKEQLFAINDEFGSNSFTQTLVCATYCSKMKISEQLVPKRKVFIKLCIVMKSYNSTAAEKLELFYICWYK